VADGHFANVRELKNAAGNEGHRLAKARISRVLGEYRMGNLNSK